MRGTAWEKRFSDTTGLPYYVNHSAGIVRFDTPEGLDEPRCACGGNCRGLHANFSAGGTPSVIFISHDPPTCPIIRPVWQTMVSTAIEAYTRHGNGAPFFRVAAVVRGTPRRGEKFVISVPIGTESSRFKLVKTATTETEVKECPACRGWFQPFELVSYVSPWYRKSMGTPKAAPMRTNDQVCARCQAAACGLRCGTRHSAPHELMRLELAGHTSEGFVLLRNKIEKKARAMARAGLAAHSGSDFFFRSVAKIAFFVRCAALMDNVAAEKPKSKFGKRKRSYDEIEIAEALLDLAKRPLRC